MSGATATVNWIINGRSRHEARNGGPITCCLLRRTWDDGEGEAMVQREDRLLKQHEEVYVKRFCSTVKEVILFNSLSFHCIRQRCNLNRRGNFKLLLTLAAETRALVLGKSHVAWAARTRNQALATSSESGLQCRKIFPSVLPLPTISRANVR